MFKGQVNSWVTQSSEAGHQQISQLGSTMEFFFIVKGIFRQSLRLVEEERDKEHIYVELAAQASLASNSFSSKVADTATNLDRNKVPRV